MASSEPNGFNRTYDFGGALSTWKDINLTELQKSLDAQGLELVENQKESMVGRKALAEKTREFKKIPDEEKLSAFKGLLKSYQTEIDNLTKRSKISENAFLNIYKLLAEAPDPYPLLEAAVDQAIKVEEARSVEAELTRLREENAELRHKVNEVNTLEAAKKKAEARAEQLEEKMEMMVQEKVSQKENELNATYDEKLRNYEERERDLQKQVALVKSQLTDLRTTHESNQAKLLDHTQRQDQEGAARFAELDMMAADLERANSRVAVVEQRNEALRAEIEAVRSGSDAEDRIKTLEGQISGLEEETARLLRALDSQKESAAAAQLALKKRDEEVLREVAAKEAEIENLKQKVRQFADYDEIKRELEIMKFVEFSAENLDEDGEDEDDLQLPDPNADKANLHRGKSLESLLAMKNKRLLDELTKLRIMHAELENSLKNVSEDLRRRQEELDQQRSLNERLENDLLQVNKHLPRTNGDAAGRSGTPGDNPQQAGLAGLNLGQKPPDLTTNPISFTSSADASILPIVTSQRDRFRQRNAELEEELRKQFDIISDLRSEVKTLQADNLKLYEKVRYMQSYRENEAGPSFSTRPPTHRPDEMGRYKNLYEQTMNPFEVFRGREAARAVQALNPIEKAVYSLTRIILGSRRARNGFVLYAVILHLLVMYTSYECTSSRGTTISEPSPFR
jgi:homeobox protein cut-like